MQRQDAGAEGFLVAGGDGDALLLHHLERLLLDGKAARSRLDRRRLGRGEEAVAQRRRQLLVTGVAHEDAERREDMLGEGVELRRLVELAGDDGRRVVLETVEHAGLQRGIDLAERHRRRRRAHQPQALGDHRVGQGADLLAGKAGGIGDRGFAHDAARAEIIGPADDMRGGALQQHVLHGLAGAAVERARLMLVALEDVAEIGDAPGGHQIGPDRGAGDHQIDDAELDRVGDVDLLAELVVGEELDGDLLVELHRLQLLDELVVVDAAIGVFRIIGLRAGEAQRHRRRRGGARQRRQDGAGEWHGGGEGAGAAQHGAARHLADRHFSIPPGRFSLA